MGVDLRNFEPGIEEKYIQALDTVCKVSFDRYILITSMIGENICGIKRVFFFWRVPRPYIRNFMMNLWSAGREQARAVKIIHDFSDKVCCPLH